MNIWQRLAAESPPLATSRLSPREAAARAAKQQSVWAECVAREHQRKRGGGQHGSSEAYGLPASWSSVKRDQAGMGEQHGSPEPPPGTWTIAKRHRGAAQTPSDIYAYALPSDANESLEHIENYKREIAETYIRLLENM